MVGRFIALVLLLVLLVGTTTLHYMLHKNSPNTMIQTLSSLTTITSPSLSVAYYEPRVQHPNHKIHPSYPDMPTMNKRGFIYAE